jgi:hypothetical protein
MLTLGSGASLASPSRVAFSGTITSVSSASGVALGNYVGTSFTGWLQINNFYADDFPFSQDNGTATQATFTGCELMNYGTGVCTDVIDNIIYPTLQNYVIRTNAGSFARSSLDPFFGNFTGLQRGNNSDTGTQTWNLWNWIHRINLTNDPHTGESRVSREVSQGFTINVAGTRIYPDTDNDIGYAGSVPTHLDNATATFSFQKKLDNIYDCLQWTNCDVHNFSPSYLQISGVINSFYEIPEPSSAALVFLGLGAAGVARRVRKGR